MEFFDRDDLKKALILISPVLLIVLLIILSSRTISSKKSDDSSSKGYSYGSKTMPFTLEIDEKRADLVWSETKLKETIGSVISPSGANGSYGVISSYPEEIEDGLSSKTFTANSIGANGSRIKLPQGFTLAENEETISSALSADCIRTKGNNDCSYYWVFYLDGREIDYSKMDYSIADDEGAYMTAMLEGAVCELYCRDQIAEGKAKICTSIMITTAEEKCDSCVIEIIKPQDLVIDEGGY